MTKYANLLKNIDRLEKKTILDPFLNNLSSQGLDFIGLKIEMLQV